MGIYTNVYAYNHLKKQGYFTNRHPDRSEAEWRDLFKPRQDRPLDFARDGEELEWQSTISKTDYQSRVQKVIDYIHAGDIFQANLSQRFEADLPEGFDPFAHYLGLRERNPAPFGGYFNTGNKQISSCSPERFLVLNNGQVETKPIKGTAPRSNDPQRDKINAEILLNSIKDRAENIMIVDLLRNDL